MGEWNRRETEVFPLTHLFLMSVPCTKFSWGSLGGWKKPVAGFWFRLGGWLGALSPAEKLFVSKSKKAKKTVSCRTHTGKFRWSQESRRKWGCEWGKGGGGKMDNGSSVPAQLEWAEGLSVLPFYCLLQWKIRVNSTNRNSTKRNSTFHEEI